MRFDRYNAIFIDYIIIVGISILISLIISHFNFISLFKNISSLLLICYILFLMKDLVFKNASIGKRLTKLEVLRKDNSVPGVPIMILRNAFIILWPIDVILIYFYNQKIGDMILKTKVVKQ